VGIADRVMGALPLVPTEKLYQQQKSRLNTYFELAS